MGPSSYGANNHHQRNTPKNRKITEGNLPNHSNPLDMGKGESESMKIVDANAVTSLTRASTSDSERGLGEWQSGSFKPSYCHIGF
jgi:hypothetical protein